MQVFRLALLLAASAMASAQSQLPASPPAPPQSKPVWQIQDSGTTAGLRGIDSVDGAVAWASGTGGTVLRTTDGGAHWQKCAVPDADKDGATLDFRGVQAWDAKTAIVMASGPGDKSRLYKTTDGCLTWTLQFVNPDKDGFFDAYVFESLQVRSAVGLLLGDPVKGYFPLWRVGIEFDPGYVELLRHRPSANKNEVAFAASNSCLFVYQSFISFFIATGGENGSRVFRVVSHGADEISWATFPSSSVPVGNHTPSSGIFSLAFAEVPGPPLHDWARRMSGYGVAVGGDYEKPNEALAIAAFTQDGGEHWIASTHQPHGYRSAVSYDARLKLWITVGTNGSDISRDDGKTWQPLDDGNWNALSLPFVVGPNGRIARLNEAALPPAK
jgi:hypothetical protein